jgi:hypothetical protein
MVNLSMLEAKAVSETKKTRTRRDLAGNKSLYQQLSLKVSLGTLTLNAFSPFLLFEMENTETNRKQLHLSQMWASSLKLERQP